MGRALPPVWMLGLSILPFSMIGAVALITVPQLLAADGVPEPSIAPVTALGLLGGVAAMLVSPMLDVRFSRRTYAIAMAAAGAALSFAALRYRADLGALGWLLFAALMASSLFQGALGGWLGSLIPPESNPRLASWFNVANIGGFGLFAYINITLIRALPVPWGAAVVAGGMLLPLLLFLPIPAPGPDRRLARESFGSFFGHVGRMVRRPSVLRLALMLLLPAACFALTNTLGGLGRDYGASERFVGLVAGIGVTIAGVGGSLAVPPLARALGAPRLYLAVALAGAAFTLSLMLLPHTPAVFALAMVGENVAQAVAFATAMLIVLDEVGKDNPLAATEFTVLLAMTQLALSYMQWLDGRGYAAGGLTGTLFTDGGLGVIGSVGIWLLIRGLRAVVAEPSPPLAVEQPG